jgi:transketolase
MDVNKQQCDGAMESVMSVGNIARKLEDFGAVVVEIDGHDIEAMRRAVKTPHSRKPLIILANSSPFRGMKFLERRFPRLHYVRFKSEEERTEMNAAISAELGIAPIKFNAS